MHQAKHLAQNRKRKAAVCCRTRIVVLMLSLALVLTAAIGGTVAYLMDSERNTSNLLIGKVACAVDIADNNSHVTVSNTGNVPAYIRLAVIANWVSDTNPNAIHYTQPQVSTSNGAEWTLNNGFYYYNTTIEANQAVTLPICVNGTAPNGYKLQVQALAEAIQENAAADAWGFSPNGN